MQDEHLPFLPQERRLAARISHNMARPGALVVPSHSPWSHRPRTAPGSGANRSAAAAARQSVIEEEPAARPRKPTVREVLGKPLQGRGPPNLDEFEREMREFQLTRRRDQDPPLRSQADTTQPIRARGQR